MFLSKASYSRTTGTIVKTNEHTKKSALFFSFSGLFALVSIYMILQGILIRDFRSIEARSDSPLDGRLAETKATRQAARRNSKKKNGEGPFIAMKGTGMNKKRTDEAQVDPPTDKVDVTLSIDLNGIDEPTTKDAFPSIELDEKDMNSKICGRTNIIRHTDISSDWLPIYYPPPLPPNVINNNSTSSIFRIAQNPIYGKHRCEKNAVMAFASGYQLPQLIHFITSLWKTGYDGDLVIGVGTNLTQETRSYLEYHARNRAGLVVYEIPLSCQRKNSWQVLDLLEQTNATKTKGTAIWTPVLDARPFRRVSVVRYEYYWAWTNRYSSESLIFLADARDVYFQRDPMQAILHSFKTPVVNNGTLVFFEEASKISESRANRKWIEKTYSSEVRKAMEDKMVICSGTTLGSQPAIESYARAMVHEFDQTKCKRCATKHDQCFHNYLIHQNRLVGANGGRISNVVVHAQGEGGIVNTVGLVSQNHDGKSLQELGLVKAETREILENDLQTISAVVHMYDRDVSMKDWVDLQIQKKLVEITL